MSSVPPPPDRPTEPLRPAQPAQPIQPVQPVQPVRRAPVVQERVAVPAGVDPNVILVRLEDAVDSLRTWLMFVGALAVIALCVAIYAIVSDDTGNGGGSRSGLASDERVSRLDDRIDRISRQVASLRASRSTSSAGGAAASALAGRVDSLESTVKSLSSQSSGDSAADVQQLKTRLDGLARDVEALKQAQGSTP
jgi:hypothetical protein